MVFAIAGCSTADNATRALSSERLTRKRSTCSAHGLDSLFRRPTRSGQRRFFAQCAAVWRSEFGPLRGKGRAGVLQCSSAGKAEHGRPVRRSGKPGGFPEAPHRRPLLDLGAIQLHLSGAHAVPFALFRAQQLPLFRKQSWFSTAIAGRWLFPASGLIWISESRFAGICGSR
jgi:hypothetical protein